MSISKFNVFEHASNSERIILIDLNHLNELLVAKSTVLLVFELRFDTDNDILGGSHYVGKKFKIIISYSFRALYDHFRVRRQSYRRII